VKVEWPDDDEAHPAVGRAYAEIVELARRTDYPVYSDDRVFRAMLAGAGIATFGTVAPVGGSLSASDLRRCSVQTGPNAYPINL